MRQSLVYVGVVSKTHGLKGELIVQLSAKRADWLSSFNGSLWFGQDKASLKSKSVQRLRVHKGGLIVKLEGLDSIDDADSWRGRLVAIPASWLVSQPGDVFFFFELQELKVENQNGELLGHWVGFETTGHQDLGVLQDPIGDYYYVPLVRDWILSTDLDAKRMVMRIPEGVLSEEMKLKGYATPTKV